MISDVFKSNGFHPVLSALWRGVAGDAMRSVAVAVVLVFLATMMLHLTFEKGPR